METTEHEAADLEPVLVNPEEVALLTGKERDDWYWDKLDALRQANVNLVDENALLRAQVDRLTELIERARSDQDRHKADIIQMGQQINAANERARTAVQEYIANTEG
jgi:hypothetical protein